METKEVTLPSGRKVTIKKPGVLALRAVHGVLPILGEKDKTNGETIDAGKELDASIKMVCMCCVEPKFSDTPADGVLSIDDLEIADFTALAQEVTAFSGFKEASEKLRPFSETPTA